MDQKTFFSKKAGMEVSRGRSTKNGWSQGCVYIKAFPLEKGGRDKQITSKVAPEEAWSIAMDIEDLLAGKFAEKEVLFHSVKDAFTTSITLATKQYQGKTFRMVYFNRKRKDSNGDSVNFPLKDQDASFLAGLLRKFALDSCFNVKEDVQEEQEYSGSPSTSGSGNSDSGNRSNPSSDPNDEEFDDIPF